LTKKRNEEKEEMGIETTEKGGREVGIKLFYIHSRPINSENKSFLSSPSLVQMVQIEEGFFQLGLSTFSSMAKAISLLLTTRRLPEYGIITDEKGDRCEK
jgi:hypothetical protein